MTRSLDSAVDGRRHFNRQRRIVVTPDVFCAMFVEGEKSFGVTKGLPENYCCRGATVDPSTGNVNIFFSHQSFEVVPEGGVVPEMRIEINTNPTRIFKEIGT